MKITIAGTVTSKLTQASTLGLSAAQASAIGTIYLEKVGTGSVAALTAQASAMCSHASDT